MDCSSPLRLFVPVLLLSIAASARGSTDSATRQACGATRSPDLCESALAPIVPSLPPNVSGTYMTLVPISKSIRDLLRSSAQIQAILESSDSNVNRSIIARNCLQFLDYSNRRLSAVDEILTTGDIPRVKDTQQVVDAGVGAGAGEVLKTCGAGGRGEALSGRAAEEELVGGSGFGWRQKGAMARGRPELEQALEFGGAERELRC